MKMFRVLSVGPRWPLSSHLPRSSFNLGRFALGNSFVVDYPSFLMLPPLPSSLSLRCCTQIRSGHLEANSAEGGGAADDPFPFCPLCYFRRAELIKYLESEVAKPRAQSLPLSAFGAAWDQLKSVPLRNYSTIRDECSQIGTVVAARRKLFQSPACTVGGRTFDSIHAAGRAKMPPRWEP